MDTPALKEHAAGVAVLAAKGVVKGSSGSSSVSGIARGIQETLGLLEATTIVPEFSLSVACSGGVRELVKIIAILSSIKLHTSASASSGSRSRSNSGAGGAVSSSTSTTSSSSSSSSSANAITLEAIVGDAVLTRATNVLGNIALAVTELPVGARASCGSSVGAQGGLGLEDKDTQSA